MVSLEVYSKYNLTKYKSTLCSKTTFFVIFTKLVSIILPFVLAYNSNGFWMKRDTFYEQPDIKFKYEYIFIAETIYLNSPKICSNIINFKDKLYNHKNDKCSTIKIREIDHNYDGINDELYFSITIDDEENLKIQSITLILPLDYKIYTCPMHMQSAAVIQYSHLSPGVKLKFISDISLTQNSPLPCNYHRIYKDYNSSLINKDTFDVSNFIEEHFRRNISTKINHSYITWISGSSTTFILDIHLRYSGQMILYKPNFWQVIKFAWVQYLAVFVAVRWIINKIENYVFTNKLVLYYIDNSHPKQCSIDK